MPGLSKRPNGVSSTSTVLTKQLSARKSLSQDVQRSLDGAVEFQKTERPKLAETYLKAGITNWLPELLLSKRLEKIQLWRSQSLHNNTYGMCFVADPGFRWDGVLIDKGVDEIFIIGFNHSFNRLPHRYRR
ncbi:hypothetical protein TWF132_000983 [Orbilia oligospora]|nr:hypothetical protein TWF132_000983 [Orbilia oligospora]